MDPAEQKRTSAQHGGIFGRDISVMSGEVGVRISRSRSDDVGVCSAQRIERDFGESCTPFVVAGRPQRLAR
jgi:hypothetical protein